MRDPLLAAGPSRYRPELLKRDTGRAMSQEDVEIVRRICEEVSLRLALPDELFDPECVTDWTQVSPDFGVLHGVEASQASDTQVWNRFFHAWAFRDRKVVWLSSHSNRERAFPAAGLSE